jgi:ferredoxin
MCHPVNESERPVPWIDLRRCNGCGLCVLACPTGALAMENGKATVGRPDACEYHGDCEMICPAEAIARPFQIVVAAGR